MPSTAHIDPFARDNLPPKDQLPEFIFELPELDFPSRLNCAAEILDKTAAAGYADRPAIHTQIDGKRYSCTNSRTSSRAICGSSRAIACCCAGRTIR